MLPDSGPTLVRYWAFGNGLEMESTMTKTVQVHASSADIKLYNTGTLLFTYQLHNIPICCALHFCKKERFEDTNIS